MSEINPENNQNTENNDAVQEMHEQMRVRLGKLQELTAGGRDPLSRLLMMLVTIALIS
jgi:hypothetical protein